MLDLNVLDLEEITNALADQTDYEHCWLIHPQTGEIVYWSADTGIDGHTRVDLDDLDLISIRPLPSWVWYQDMEDFAGGITDERTGRRLARAIQARVPSAGSKTNSTSSIRTCFPPGMPSVRHAPCAAPSNGWPTTPSSTPTGKGTGEMSRVVVIGATGHIGTYLVPRLVDGGHEVIAVSRGTRGPYHASPQWDAVTTVTADREAEDAAGTFGDRVAALRPEVVIDLICFTRASARQLIEALRPSRPLLVHCGTIWVHGPALRVPVTEDEPRTAYGEYGTGKAEIEALLHQETRAGGVPAVVLHPGHISGPGWPVITPAGNLDPATWT